MPYPVLDDVVIDTQQSLGRKTSTSSHDSSIWRFFRHWMQSISSNGLQPFYNNRLRISITLTNWIIVTCVLFTIPFLCIGLQKSYLVVALPLLSCLLSFLILRRGNHLIARVFLVNALPLSIYVIALVAQLPGATHSTITKPLFFASLIIPLLIFRAIETRYFIGSLVFICALLFSVDFALTVFPFKFLKINNINLSLLRTIITVEGVAFIVIALIYYKYLMDKIARQNYRLLQDMRGQNEKIQQTNEELKASAVQLKELNDSKNRLFSIIAHDLRSPMNSFRGFSGLLASNIDSLSKEDIKVLVKGMSKSFNNVNTLLENLLHWSRVQMNTFSSQAEVVDLAVLITDNLSLVEPTAADKLIVVKGDVAEELYAFIDKNIFNIVLRNLLMNAIKFTNSKGKVEVRAKRTGTQITIDIIDNGIGMSPTTLGNLFTSQNHNHSTVGTANEKGTGLGLMLCKEFITQWGGTIKAVSSKGDGSTFSFTVPAYQKSLFED
ncbi:sensor histidine kinase [Xanthocytophaga flava]|uniref:sensor histidine kinase n=1 Tax=Xanthocytophaga flava TaxID=3048013 RepID=UPI0028D6B692|nr:HAMP domain-containing sensor histidine kinase [Xanthocytophaga flavus]MDJ1471439.1 HAMP domain-containing sensor histidine kinase [Xanthocytophaga flavus]